MLRAVPDGWSSSSFTISDRSGTPVGRVELSKRPWREVAKLEAAGIHYQAHVKGRVAKQFLLETEDGEVVLAVEQPSVWRNRFVFEYLGNRYELKKSGWGSTFIL